MTKQTPRLKKNPHTKAIGRKFEMLVDVMHTLRAEDGCPWDRAQTLRDLKQYLLEETYEVLQSLDNQDEQELQEELGDLLLQVVFLTQILQEKNSFTLLEVLDRLNQKLIERHPHVFGSVQAGTPEEAVGTWEAMKSREKAVTGKTERSVLQGIPSEMPALLQAHLISTKVTRLGFDWDTEEDVWKKLQEEMEEFRSARTPEDKEEEMGDVLFTMVNIARKNGVNCEDALRLANFKFRKRFVELEKQVYSQNKEVTDLSLKELDEIWDKVKRITTPKKGPA